MKRTLLTTFLAMSLAPSANAIDVHGLVSSAAWRQNMPVSFVMAVARQETGVRCGLVGRAGEVGPLQIKPATSQMIGLPVTRKSSCERQTEAGVRHLALCLKGAHGNQWRASVCHNAGLGSLKWNNPPRSAQKYANAVAGKKRAVPVAKRVAAKPPSSKAVANRKRAKPVIKPTAHRPVIYRVNFNQRAKS
jgi:soluble lytic murein transglycosylase-like protein